MDLLQTHWPNKKDRQGQQKLKVFGFNEGIDMARIIVFGGREHPVRQRLIILATELLISTRTVTIGQNNRIQPINFKFLVQIKTSLT